MKRYKKISVAIALSLVILISFSLSASSKEFIDEASYNQYLIKSLEDENIGIRTSAAKLLGERKVLAAIKPLVNMLKHEKSYAARIVAAIALHQIGDEQVLPVLKQRARKDNNKTVRRVLAGIIEQMEARELIVRGGVLE